MSTLNAQELIAEARHAVGFDDLDDDGLPERLTDLASQLDERLDDDGRVRAENVIRGLLIERLQLLEARHRLPIADERIERPIVAFGEGRSGTTVLQMLLGCDPGSRLLEFWEVMRMSPPPATVDTAERQKEADEDWREIVEQIPKWLVSHPYNAMLGKNPPEDERLWAVDFRSLPPTAWWRVPTVQFPAFRFERDDVRQYELHRMVLQHLQYGAPSRRWVLKGVTHQHRLSALLEAYPDAVFVWIHRDPLVALASRVQLQIEVYEGIAGPIDRKGFAAASVERSVADFTSAATTPLAADPRIHHLVYQDFIVDPMAAIRDIYSASGLEVTTAFEDGVTRYREQNAPHRFGRFAYSPDDLGVDLDDLNHRLDPYRERFGVPREPVPRGGAHGVR
ncbi:MAG TPA: sulfotransferase [Acidimicrobiales bacterium]